MKKPINDIEPSEIQRLFSLEIETGILRRKIAPPHHPQRLGEQVGTRRKHGYLETNVRGRSYLVHRLVWVIFHGDWPKEEIDHIDLDKSNNAPANLREATRLQNIHNRGAAKTNKLGVKGVYFEKESGCFRALIGKGYKRISLGRFETLVEAKLAYDAAAMKIAGDYAYVAPDYDPA